MYFLKLLLMWIIHACMRLMCPQTRVLTRHLLWRTPDIFSDEFRPSSSANFGHFLIRQPRTHKTSFCYQKSKKKNLSLYIYIYTPNTKLWFEHGLFVYRWAVECCQKNAHVIEGCRENTNVTGGYRKFCFWLILNYF